MQQQLTPRDIQAFNGAFLAGQNESPIDSTPVFEKMDGCRAIYSNMGAVTGNWGMVALTIGSKSVTASPYKSL